MKFTVKIMPCEAILLPYFSLYHQQFEMTNVQTSDEGIAAIIQCWNLKFWMVISNFC